ncbi:MAG: Cna B-type domain-containing protein, partial [Lachnospiraceae bacterium]|nr:Cna B-type domain-containing protein [Lachnospiraceae bacterium]
GKLTNYYTPETVTVSGKKIWNDNNNQDKKRPGSITVRLLANNEEKTRTTVKADADGNWTYSFENLPKYEDGQEITYTVTEDAVAEYSTEIKDYNITNSYTPGETSVTVTKAWDDQNNQDGKRQPVQVQLYADGVEEGTPVTLGEAVNWTHTWEHLAEKKAGKAITYTVRELTEVPGYTSQVTGDAKTGFTVINTYTPETTSLTFTKKWVDDGNKDGTRPGVGSFMQSLSLMDGDGKVNGYTPDVKDNGDNTYTVTYSGLPKYKDGKEISYFVQEKNIAGYVQSSSTVKNGGTLTNTKTNTKVKTALTVRGGDSSPKTGDNSNIYLYGIAGVSALALLLLLLMWKKRRDGKAE